MTAIKGSKGGSANARVPVESPDSIQSTSYAKILLALGEGEFAGNLDGSRIFLDGTPLNDSNGNANFSGVSWAFRPGTPDQSYIPGFPGVENEITVSTELTSKTPWTRLLPNINLSAVRLRFSWAALQQQHDNGDVGGYRIEYAIDIATDGGSYREVLKTAIDGKTTTSYERSHRIDLPTASTGWQIRVRRITPNSTSNRIADKMAIEAITEVIDAKLRYPETALLLMQFDAQQFQNIPVISCEPDGRIIRVPTNYDAQTRRYSGSWDGTFKWAFSNNPAWVYYDIQLSERFGLGERIKATHLVLSKWTLYQIAQYCDQLVPDGHGGSGTEPRFLCDVYIQSQEEAWTVLNDLAAIFRGSSFWANNQMNVLADMPREMDYVVTRANVRDGRFTYSNASSKTHYSTAMVAWSDPDNAYQDAVEAVADNKLVRRYGIKQADVTAIGCTRQTEAIRRGKWILHTNDADRTVSYTMGLDGDIPVPGAIVGIADALLAGRPLGGRISAVDGRNITLDRVSSAAIGERLILNLPSGKAEGRTIEAVNDKVVTVTTAYSETPVPESVWAVDANDLALQQYRVIGVKEGEDSASFDITAIEFDPDKFAKIDTGARIESRPISLVPPSVQPAPNNVAISGDNRIEQGITITTLHITWDKADSAIAYEVQWRRDNGNWISAARTSTLGVDVPGIYAGRYQARVRAINATEISSLWANAQETTLTGKVGNPPALASFTTTALVFGIQLDWQFPADTDDTLKTEIQYSPSSDGQNTLLLTDVAYPTRAYQQMGLSVGQAFFYRARIVDKSGNQGPWTGWIYGESSTDVSAITDVVLDELAQTEVFKRLQTDVEHMQSDISNTLKAEDGEAFALGIINNAIMNGAQGMVQRKEQGDRIAEIRRVDQVVVTDRESTATALQQLKAENEDTQAYAVRIDQAFADYQGAQAIEMTQLKAETEDTKANFQELNSTVVDLASSTTESIQLLTASVDNTHGVADAAQQQAMTATAAVSSVSQAVANLDGSISAQLNMKVQGKPVNGKYVVAGIGIGISSDPNNPDVTQSEILFQAQKFGFITNPQTGQSFMPFYINEHGQVMIDMAVMGTARITDAMIGDVIKSNDFETGKSGWMINKTGVSEFNDVVYRGDIKSDDYIKSSSGWIIKNDGYSEFNNAVYRGSVYATSGEFRGKIYATDGEFRGTVYAKDGRFEGTVYANKIEGDVIQVYQMPPIEHEQTRSFRYRGGQDQIMVISSSAISMTISAKSKKDEYGYLDFLINGRVVSTLSGLIPGEGISAPGVIAVEKSVNLIKSFSYEIPAGASNVLIQVRTRGTARCSADGILFLLSRKNSSVFS